MADRTLTRHGPLHKVEASFGEVAVADRTRLEELLGRWEELRDQGQRVSAEDLCRDCPELAPELEKRLRALQSTDRRLESPSTKATEGGSVGTPEFGWGETVSPVEAGHPVAELLGGNPAGVVFGEYLVLERVGSGGMGEVFEALHRRMNRVVALKVISPALTHNLGAVQRFHREMEAAARLHHPNIVTAFDAGEQRGVHYLAMEFVEGTHLAEEVRRRGPLPADVAVGYLLQAAGGLEHALHRGIVHRDIKPSNLLLDREGTLKVLDFGLARLLSPALAGQGSTAPEFPPQQTEQPPAGAADVTQIPAAGGAATAALTGSGAFMGTIDFMAPEQADNPHRADHRADIYSLGCTLYFLLTGVSPAPAGTLQDKLAWHRSGGCASLLDARKDLPPKLVAVFRRMVAKRPQDRYQSVAGLTQALLACRPQIIGARPPARKNWRRSLAGALVIASVIALLAVSILGRSKNPGNAPDMAVIHNSIGMRLVRIEPGEFLMGSPESDSDADTSEKPRHRVKLTRPFYMAAYELTQGEFERVMGRNPSFHAHSRGGFRSVSVHNTERLPVERVTWKEAVEFCNKLSRLPEEKRVGRSYRLPTEAEWEYACRAGTATRFSTGDKVDSLEGSRQVFGEKEEKAPMPVGWLKPNAWGLYDMHGNVREWCADYFGPYTDKDQVDPTGPPVGDAFVVRGGCYWFRALDGRSASRFGIRPEGNESNIGFRVAMDP